LEDRLSVTEEAIERIRAMIASGELGPGDRLPNESDLATRLSISRNSLREAIRALSLIHVVDVRQGDGTYVSSLQPERLSEGVSFVIDFHRDREVAHLLQVRRILEPAASALAAARAQETELERLAMLLSAMRAADAAPQLVELDQEFHAQIASCSGNPVLASMIQAVSSPTIRARIWRAVSHGEAVERTHSEHEAIHAAIAAHDPELAAAAAATHVAGVERWLREVVGEDGA
jgi:GntR family transcriptional regulator, transcriptional repressor for pyruvate dehydrogenase complex